MIYNICDSLYTQACILLNTLIDIRFRYYVSQSSKLHYNPIINTYHLSRTELRTFSFA